MNILTIDVGNTNIAICLFNKEKPIRFVKIRNTDITKTALQKYLLIKNSFTNIVISSVVPSISKVIINFLKLALGRELIYLIFRVFGSDPLA